jgi:glutamyl-tRNA synthetase
MGKDRQETTRLAPSPTGALHLGNARTFLINWAMARRLGWRIVLRIEDLDTPRVKPGAIDGIADTLRWLGIDWDAPVVGPPDSPLIQSRDLEPYRDAMRALAERGLAYPCELTRAQIEAAASAPQEGSHETPFPKHLRPAVAGAPIDFDKAQADARNRDGGVANWRFFCPTGDVAFTDRFAKAQSFDPSEIIGDFVLWTKRDLPSYQLAVVVDDDRQGVTQIVRGEDLLDSAARQLLLYRALGLGPEPDYWHLPLVLGSDGRRLAKRHGDTRIDHYREKGVPAEAVIGLIAHWSIPGVPRAALSAAEFKNRFDPATMRRTSVVFTSEDDAWLLSQARR